MTEKDTALTVLRQEKRNLDEKLSRLKRERDAIDTSISYLMGSNLLSLDETFEEVGQKSVGPTDAVRNLFNLYPQKKWLPGHLRDELNVLKNVGLLESESENLLSSVHWILRALYRDGEGEIEKGGKGKIKWYRKLENSQM